MATTARLLIPLLEAAQSEKEVTINNALNTFDAAAVLLTEANNFTFGVTFSLSGAATTWANGSNMVFGTGSGTKIGTGTTQKIGFFNKTPVVQPVSGTEIRQALTDLGLLALGGANALNTNGGDVIGLVLRASDGFMGSGTPFRLPSNSITPGSDGDVTVSTPQADKPTQILAAGAWTSGHNVILPTVTDAVYFVFNNSGFNAVFKTVAGTGVTVANGKFAIIYSGGVNYVRVTLDA